MFLEVLRYETLRAFRRASTYIYAAILFAGGFLLINALGGAFDSFSIVFAGDQIKINSPYLIDMYLSVFSLLGVFVTAAIVGTIVIKDYSHGTFAFLYTTRIRKWEFLSGRFLAAVLVNAVVFLAPIAGLIIGGQMPWLESGLFGEFVPTGYLSPYLIKILPNIFFIAAIFFGLSQWFRSTAANWFCIILFYVLYAVGMNLVSDIDYRWIGALADPFGLVSTMVVTSGITAQEANTQIISAEGLYLINRLLWVSFGILLLGIIHRVFRFDYIQQGFSIFTKSDERDTNVPDPSGSEAISVRNRSLPSAKKLFSPLAKVKQFGQIYRTETWQLFKNPYFLLIILSGLIFLFVTSGTLGKMYDTSIYPVTSQVVNFFSSSLHLFVFIVIVLFSGDMVHRERRLNVHEIHFSLPVNRLTILAGKFTAMLTAVMVMLSMIVVAGVIVQYQRGFYQFEPLLYLKMVFGIKMLDYVLLAILAFFVHTLVDNKYVSYFLLGLYYIWDSYFAQSVLQHNLLIYGGAPPLTYSAMNGYGHDLSPYLWFKLFWVSVGAVMLTAVHHLWVNHLETSLKAKIFQLRERLTRKLAMGYVITCTAVVIIGGFIFYNTNILNEFTRSYTEELKGVEYEKTYERFKQMPQPKITSISMNAELYPKSGNLDIKADYRLKNKTGQPVDTLLVDASSKRVSGIQFSGSTTRIKNDERLDVQLYRLAQPLQPGDSLKLSFSYHIRPKGFANNGYQTPVQPNGTFFNRFMLPSIGYDPGRELSRPRMRRKHNLPKKSPAPARNDSLALIRNNLTRDADFIDFEAVIGTAGDQIALAPGSLKKQWTKEDRNYFRYEMERPMLSFFAVLSARYQVKRDQWVSPDSYRKVDIEVYHHPGHEYNVDRMIDGAQQSLDYYSEHYSEYPHEQVRIVEFPRFASFAQAFPGLIPFSESIGFIADLRELEQEDVSFEDLKIDYPFYVTAHEVAHQWWAHQVIPANTEGATMIVETLAQYSALKVMEQYYGEEKLKKFLRRESFKYLTSRKGSTVQERPLATVLGTQQFVFYRKGAVVMYALDDYIGEEKITKVLREFIRNHRFEGAPYPTTKKLVQSLKNAAPDSLKYFVEDGLQKVTTYKLSVDSATYHRTPDFEYIVKADIEAHKFYQNSQGEEAEVEMNDYVEIGIYNSSGKVLFMEKVQLQSGQNSVTFTLPRKPRDLVVDPRYKLLSKEITKPKTRVMPAE